jgi:aryl-alcohol dehydrogenase-like predicted oxidoreductase
MAAKCVEIGLGTSQLGERLERGECSLSDAYKIFDHCLEIGITTFDLSLAYGKISTAISKYIAPGRAGRLRANLKTLPGLTEYPEREQLGVVADIVNQGCDLFQGHLNFIFLNKPDIARLNIDCLDFLLEEKKAGKISGIGLISRNPVRDRLEIGSRYSAFCFEEVNICTNLFSIIRDVDLHNFRELGVRISGRSMLSDGFIPWVQRRLDGTDCEPPLFTRNFPQELIDERYQYCKEILSEFSVPSILDLAFDYGFHFSGVDSFYVGAYNEHQVDDIFNRSYVQRCQIDAGRLVDYLSSRSATLKFPTQY